MRAIIVCLLCSLLPLAACKKRDKPQPLLNTESAGAEINVCGLLTSQEIEAVQGSPIKDAKSSGQPGEGMLMSQCFYTAAEFNRSVSLAVTQADPKSPNKRSANEYWEETFGKYDNEAAEKEGKEKAGESESEKEKKESLHEQQREHGEEEETKPPKKIEGVGDEAFWSGSRVGGALYVLKKNKDAFIRISVGGPDAQEVKIDKSKRLAQKALDRL